MADALICPSCRGSVKPGKRGQTVEAAMAIHEPTCPGKGRRIKETK